MMIVQAQQYKRKEKTLLTIVGTLQCKTSNKYHGVSFYDVAVSESLNQLQEG